MQVTQSKDIEDIKALFENNTQETFYTSLMDWSKATNTPTFQLNTAFCSNAGFRRSFHDWNKADFKEYPKLTDEAFLEKARTYGRKGKRFAYVITTFFGNLTIQVYNGTECTANVKLDNGMQEHFTKLVELYHSL
jgi:hypothetical protein